jgi:hypothetical protein
MSETSPDSSTPPANLPDPGPTDPPMSIPWSPLGAFGMVSVVVLMVGGALPMLLQSGSMAVIVMGVLFIFFASSVAGAIVYTSTLDG